jgi:cardiolipin synthase A/B
MLIALLLAGYALGALSAVSALMNARTPQGTVAWILALLTVPWIAVPAYWIVGSPRFEGYVSARRGGDSRLRGLLPGVEGISGEFRTRPPETRGGITAVERLARMPVVRANRTALLTDGKSTFDQLFAGIRGARRYVLVQFYTIEDDTVGARLKHELLAAAQRGVSVFLLFDRIGSRSLSSSWVRELQEAGVEVHAFLSSRAWIRQQFRPRIQINFRNHRKIVVVDGREGWMGGYNVGEVYLGRHPELGKWRDTHLHVEGPAVLAMQLAFVEDWHWTTERVPDLEWEPTPATDGDEAVLMLPSGPADQVESATLMYHHAIHAARKRLWIATPYFVPDEGIVTALKLAAFRGVDVRILTPLSADVPLVHLAKFAAVEPLLRAGVRVLRYAPGFLHSKLFLVDDRAAGVGTVNLDNRSLRLNFEITALLLDPGAIRRVEALFEEDMAAAEDLTLEEVVGRSLGARLASRAAYLLAPVL